MKTFHHSTLDSPRIAKLLDFLKQRGHAGATTLEITANCETTRASSDISELRANGVDVSCSYEGKTATGRSINRYALA